jgi:Leucine-rich repeat (LRR) protein
LRSWVYTDVTSKEENRTTMNKIWVILLTFLFSVNLYSQGKSCCQTYVYEGSIETTEGQKLKISLNFLVLLDSTLVGSYYYNPQNGTLKLVGHLNSDNTINLIERDKNDSITGFFNGIVSLDYSTVNGQWLSAEKDKKFKFELTQVKGKSYWDFIKKNRALVEYSNLKLAINENEKVLSIDVASQGLSKLPRKLNRLDKIVSINLLGNEFKSLPIVLTKLTTLDEISLSSNDLTAVTSKIGRLKNLRILIMNNNQLTELPPEIGEITNLLYLEIGNNKLTTLPDEIKYLTSLQELHIERNNLNEIEKGRIKKLLPNCVIHF